MDNNKMKEILERMKANRPKFPKRAIVTGGMPYGNKELHYGHVCGMMVYADFFARFLKDKLGKENVIFVSGTDCYGSPSLETYRKWTQNGYTGTIEDMVKEFNQKHINTINKYEIGFDWFEGSAIGESKEMHKKVSDEIFERLYKNGTLSKLSTYQFYDAKVGSFLNGRQVVGKCPIDGCKSEKGYADECDLGHQYLPEQLIDPVSTLSGTTPELKKIENWYFNLQNYTDLLKEWIEKLNKETPTRDFVLKEIKEFLKKPEIYIKKDYMEAFEKIEHLLPHFEKVEDKSKASFVIIFDSLTDREKACEILSGKETPEWEKSEVAPEDKVEPVSAGAIRYRTGKTLVPFRLSGNISWGVPVPEKEGLDGLTFYCWPESLWAPISFTRAYLKHNGYSDDEWKKYWCSKDAKVYQVLGEDNIYFYGPAQHAMWLATQEGTPRVDAPDGDLQISQLIVNKHSLFMGNKASSSGSIKPPMADELLNHYTHEQLRSHFLALSVGNTSSSFNPKVYNPDADPNEVDPVVKDGNLLTNVYNRALRTIFYTWQKDFDGVVPYDEVAEEVLNECEMSILKYEKCMMENKFHMCMYELDSFLRNINKYWTKNFVQEDKEKEKECIVNTLHYIKVAMVMLHSVAPKGIENLAEYLGVDESIFNWDRCNETIYNWFEEKENHRPKFIEAKFDFFKKHPSQFETND
ncbi:MAG: class I tRNA ligase family protein [Clostridia bacterium]|nr:class I tRNA ligase family protein [Clostridia bacterium]